MSNITTSNIDQTYPVAAVDNDSQGFRNNFTNIVTALEQAKTEITNLETITGYVSTTSVAPLPKGATGDQAGMVVYDGSYLYVCFKDYTLGTEQIWTRCLVDAPTDLSNW